MRELIEDPGTVRIVNVVSIIEIAFKFATGKLEMDERAMHEAIEDLRLTELAFEPQHAFELFSLPPHHRDPFDRMILATAIAEQLPIVSGDGVFRRYSDVKVIW